MGKRSGSNDYESIAKKIKKLQQSLKHARRKETRRSSSSSDSSSSSSSSSDSQSELFCARGDNNLSQPLSIEGLPIQTGSAVPVLDNQDNDPVSQPSTSAATLQLPTSVTDPQASTSFAASQPDLTNTVLDPELMDILGEDPSLKKKYGVDIHGELSIRLQHIVCSGLDKDVRKTLLDKYITPENCKLIDAPTLNPEVKVSTPDSVLKRDKNIEYKQKQLTSATTCVATALTELLTAETKNANLIKILMDAAKLMCDAQHMDSVTRRNFVLNGVKPELKNQLQATKIGEYLFGDNLGDTLKAAKAIIKSGSEMKSTPTPQKNTKLPQKHLNWRGPPQNFTNRPKGNLRTKKPVYNKSRHENFSPQSSRPPQTRPSDNRNRR